MSVRLTPHMIFYILCAGWDIEASKFVVLWCQKPLHQDSWTRVVTHTPGLFWHIRAQPLHWAETGAPFLLLRMTCCGRIVAYWITLWDVYSYPCSYIWLCTTVLTIVISMIWLLLSQIYCFTSYFVQTEHSMWYTCGWLKRYNEL